MFNDPLLAGIQTLETNPLSNAAKWNRDIISRAASLCPALGGLFELGILETDAEWTARHPAQPDPLDPAVLIQTPKPASPVRPPPPAGNATSAAIAQCNRLTLEFTEFSNAISVLKLEMLSSVGATIRTELEDPTYGHALLSPLQIRNHVNNKYGTLKEVDLT